MIVVQSRSCLYVVFWKVCGDAGQAMRARHSECSVVIGQNETQQTTSQQHQQHQSQQQQPVQKPGTEKSTEVGSRLSNGSLDLAEQDSAVRVIDLQATLDKQVRISISIYGGKWLEKFNCRKTSGSLSSLYTNICKKIIINFHI